MVVDTAKSYESREIIGKPSTENIQKMRDRYLAEPLMIDTEYMDLYTEAHKRTDGLNVLERRAECHAYAMENLTPSIRGCEPFVGSKTQYVRGAIPYCNYASSYVCREFSNEEQEHQDKVTDIGTGGGIAKAKNLADKGDYILFGSKFLLPKENHAETDSDLNFIIVSRTRINTARRRKSDSFSAL